MTDLRKAAEQAAKVLANALSIDFNDKRDWYSYKHDVEYAANLLRQAIAQDEPWDTSDMAYRPNGLSVEQEPYGYVYEINGAHTEFSKELPPDDAYDEGTLVPVFTAPPSKPEQTPFELKWPDYNESAMGCGLEDRNITDRYEAMQYGWDEAISRISECLPDVLLTATPSKTDINQELVEALQKIMWTRPLNRNPSRYAHTVEEIAFRVLAKHNKLKEQA